MSLLIKTKESFIRYINRTSTIPTGVDGPTPSILIESIFEKLTINIDWKDPNLKILDPSFGFGSFLFFSYLKLKEYHSDEHILNNMLYGVEIEPFRFELVKTKFNIKNIFKEDFLNPSDKLKKILNMKFDVIVGNPPYQMQVGPDKTETIWNRFVIKSISHLKEDGYLSLIHPSGWRNIDGKFKDVQNQILSKDLIYLEIHNEKDGIKMFGAETRYDWYVLKNSNTVDLKTKIKFQSGNIVDIDVKKLEFIPNDDYDFLKSLIANENEKSVDILYSRSSYGTDKENTSNAKDNKFVYPCVYTVTSESIPTLFYSSVNTKGHFNIPKLIWSNGRISSIGSYIDETGEFGLTQFAYAIVDNPKTLPLIKQAFDTPKFRRLMENCAVGQLTINYKVLSKFRKDFWKQFI
jgi:hypothetical protein